MKYRVDTILDNWFGEPPEWSEDEKKRIRHLYAPLRALEDELNRLKTKLADKGWESNPDRMGGQFTQDEIDRARGHG